ncbi:MAG TPA: ribulose-phosphate 3-epimerase [Terriglobia bacterium]|nr:ribulose-phosphate 3-epimerase [Terriglobia bacterium]
MASIVPSLLAGDFARLGESLDVVETLGVSSVHVDVMDGHFRPQISVGQPVVRSLRKATRLKVDVHLMVERPGRYIEDFVKAGADSLAIHLEATENVALAIGPARRLGIEVGLALNESTPVATCFEVLEDLDFVLVETGTGRSLPRSLKKVAVLAKERETCGLNFAIAAEGDIGADEAGELLPAGVDILVVGSAIFDKKERGEAMRAFARALSGSSPAFGQELKSRVQ